MTSNNVHMGNHNKSTITSALQKNIIPFHTIETNGVKLSITNMKIVARWRYNLNNQVCPICKVALGKPIESRASRNYTYKTTIDIGICNDGLHEKCISEWLSNNNTDCPECKNVWKKQSSVNAGVISYVH